MDHLDQSSVTGCVGIQDATGMTTSHVALYQPAMVKKSTMIMQNAYPMRPKAVHLFNLPTIMEKVVTLFRSFMNEKMKSRIHVHNSSDLAPLHESLGKEVLPEEYGGTNGTVADQIKHTLDIVEARRSWLIEQTKFKSDETKRPGEPKTFTEIFGMEGSFRKLAVD